MLVIFLLVQAPSFSGVRFWCEWYVSALIRDVQTREGSDG